MVRDAKFADIPAILDLLAMQFRLTHYHRDGTVNIDERAAKQLLTTAIQRHGKHAIGGTFVQVALTGNLICGVLVGALSRVYAIGDKLMASDLFWTSSEMVDPRDPPLLMRNFITWAFESPDVAEVRVGVTRVISEDPARISKILKRMGMVEYGLICRLQRKAT